MVWGSDSTLKAVIILLTCVTMAFIMSTSVTMAILPGPGVVGEGEGGI